MNNFQKADEIRDKADIVAIISEYVKLEKKGNDYVGLCPFHDDKNPSMHVSPSKKIFKCFSCNTGGNVIGFVQKYKKISYLEALREVAKTVGISVEVTKTEMEHLKNKKYYDLLNDAKAFYQFYLNNTYEGKEALAYLHKRHLTPEIIERFKIGLSGKDQADLFKALLEKQHLALDMIDVGLVRYYNDEYYDTFRRRIMFPITNLDGHVVGFSGRIYLPNSNEAKYVNSNETVVFKKSGLLYNYYESLDAIKEEKSVFLFEGFLDVIAAYRAGIKNAIASMGTALTPEQVNAIRRVTNNVIICYDGDTPGIEATKRAVKLFAKQNINVNVINLPDNLDPDDYINKYGEQKLNELLRTTSIFAMDYLYEISKQDLIISDITSIENFKNEIFNHLSSFNSNVIIEKYLRRMANDLNLSFQSLFVDFNASKKLIPEVIYEVPVPHTKLNNILEEIRIKRYDMIQKALINMAIKYPEKCVEIDTKFNNYYVKTENTEIMFKIIHAYELNNDVNADEIKSDLSPDLLNVFNQILNIDIPNDVSNINILFNEFKSYPTEKELQALREKQGHDKEDIGTLIKLKKKVTKIKLNKKD